MLSRIVENGLAPFQNCDEEFEDIVFELRDQGFESIDRIKRMKLLQEFVQTLLTEKFIRKAMVKKGWFRHEPLGKDREENCYWYVAGSIFVEMHGKECWREYQISEIPGLLNLFHPSNELRRILKELHDSTPDVEAGCIGVTRTIPSTIPIERQEGSACIRVLTQLRKKYIELLEVIGHYTKTDSFAEVSIPLVPKVTSEYVFFVGNIYDLAQDALRTLNRKDRELFWYKWQRDDWNKYIDMNLHETASCELAALLYSRLEASRLDISKLADQENPTGFPAMRASEDSSKWVCCDNCDKWRMVDETTFVKYTQPGAKFYCKYLEGVSCQTADDEKQQESINKQHQAAKRDQYAELDGKQIEKYFLETRRTHIGRVKYMPNALEPYVYKVTYDDGDIETMSYEDVSDFVFKIEEPSSAPPPIIRLKIPSRPAAVNYPKCEFPSGQPTVFDPDRSIGPSRSSHEIPAPFVEPFSSGQPGIVKAMEEKPFSFDSPIFKPTEKNPLMFSDPPETSDMLGTNLSESFPDPFASPLVRPTSPFLSFSTAPKSPGFNWDDDPFASL